VIEYTGDLISRREARRRAGLNGHVYLFSVNPYWSKDGASGGSGAEYINHSCDPNVRACVIKGHILYFSRRVILPGEELLVDYNFAWNAERHHCHCGASVCRGMINAK
jgi:SET domain-containing protein